MKKYYLMAPGPTPVPSNVLLAMAQPMIHHRTPEYDALFSEVRAGLKRLFKTGQDVIPFTSSGTGAMEAAVANTLSAGDRVLVLRAGKFGERWEESCRAYGVTVIPLAAPFGHTVPAEAFRKALDEHRDVKAVLMQHSESSTAVLHDVKGVAAVTRDSDAILIVDAVSSLGIADLRMDEWGVDLVVAGSQKGLMLPPGLSFCALSEKAWGHVKVSRLPKYYFDLTAEWKAVSKNEAHFTPAVSIVLGLREVLRAYSASHNITIAGGQGEMKGKVFRLGHMGYVGDFDVLTALAALEQVLHELGQPVDFGAAVRAAQKVFAERA